LGGGLGFVLSFASPADEVADAEGEDADCELAGKVVHVVAVAAGHVAAAAAFAGAGRFAVFASLAVA
jgi:hypothetical protein